MYVIYYNIGEVGVGRQVPHMELGPYQTDSSWQLNIISTCPLSKAPSSSHIVRP